MRSMVAVVAVLFAVSCGGDPVLVQVEDPVPEDPAMEVDAGEPEPQPEVDAGPVVVIIPIPEVDAGEPVVPEPEVDAGTPPEPEVDAGVPPEPEVDAGTPEVDAGQPPYDGPGNSENTPRCDAGRGKKLGLIKHGKCE